jgi:superfamily II DNA or RNA helicase
LVLNNSIIGTKVLTRLQQGLRSCNSFQFYVAFVNQEGIACLMQALLDAQSKGVRGRVLVSQYLNFTEPQALRTLQSFGNLSVRIATKGSVHAKGYCFRESKRDHYLIGSSNWTASALSTNTELNVEIEADPESAVGAQFQREFSDQFSAASPITADFLARYEEQHHLARSKRPEELEAVDSGVLRPNTMQLEALAALESLRSERKRKALIVSATGTGKTFLSAFDAKEFKAKRLLFVVHRENIARAAMGSYQRVFGSSKTYGLYTGTERNPDADFLFSTVQTLSKQHHLSRFSAGSFDYIVVDESHRSGAKSYERFLNFFRPGFLLGMTATPERTDGADIFSYFDHNVAYEIRLNRALQEGMLCPFHYYGVVDMTRDGKSVDEFTVFNKLVSMERATRIYQKAKLYGTHDGVTRGLIFCSRVEEANALSEQLNRLGLRTLALGGDSPEEIREDAIRRLEAKENSPAKLDYILTVDIFNEGVDIPTVNQIILLRPTQSAIIFVQQLGRGLRKLASEKKYLTVIDFIGNYQNNFLIPIALFGDRSYDKDKLRRLLKQGSDALPGSSTVDFEPIARERIFDAINKARLDIKADLSKEVKALQARIGRMPMMVDFVKHDARDPMAFVDYAKSYYSFLRGSLSGSVPALPATAERILQVYSKHVLNGKTLEESLILRELLKHQSVSVKRLNLLYVETTGAKRNRNRWLPAFRSANLSFIRDKKGGVLKTVAEILGISLLVDDGKSFKRTKAFSKLINNETFRNFLEDLIDYSVLRFMSDFKVGNEVKGFQRYRKYSRADVFRILGATENPVAQNVGGYWKDPQSEWCPIFVTYKKQDDIAATIQYEDRFINPKQMEWFTKSKRTLQSPDVAFFRTAKPSQRIPLFVQKSNDEGIEFYYLGDVRPCIASFQQSTMKDEEGRATPVVKMILDLDHEVEPKLYEYFVGN